MNLTLLPGRLAIARLPAASAIPDWATRGAFVSIARTADELSIVCPEEDAPSMLANAQHGRRALKVEGPLDFALAGILSALLEPLALAKISIFAISTYDTDYVLVAEEDLPGALAALEGAGHAIVG